MASLPFCLSPFPFSLFPPASLVHSTVSHSHAQLILHAPLAVSRNRAVCSRLAPWPVTVPAPQTLLHQRGYNSAALCRTHARTHWFGPGSVRGSLTSSASLRPHTPLSHHSSLHWRKALFNTSSLLSAHHTWGWGFHLVLHRKEPSTSVSYLRFHLSLGVDDIL